MARYTKTGTPSTIGQVNAELDNIALAIDDTLSRVGDSPNQLATTFDANDNRIINLRAPVGATEPLRLGDIGGFTVTTGTDETLVVDSVAAMALLTLAIGTRVVCKRYYTAGALVEGLVYEIESGTGDGYINHTMANSTTKATLLYSRPFDVRLSGATGSGDDSPSLQAAANLTGEITFLDAHTITTDIDLTGKTVISPINTQTTITNSTTGLIFSSACTDLKVTGIKAVLDGTLVSQIASFNKLEITNCDFEGVVNVFTNYLLLTSASTTGGHLKINNNKAQKCTAWYGDDCPVQKIEIRGNEFLECSRFVVRNLAQAGTAVSKNIYVTGNTVTDINGSLADKASTARFLQIAVSGTAYVLNNLMDGAESTVASNFIYIQDGNLICKHNVVKNIKSINTISIIDDKNVDRTEKHWDISNNTFDQTGISLAQSPEAAIRINEAKNVSISYNKFIGLTCYPARFYHSLDLGRPPERVSFTNNEIHSLNWPIVCQVYQNIKKASIADNKIYSITNTNTISVNGRTRCRVTDIYQSFSNSDNLDGVSVKGNVVYKCPADSSVATIFRNAAASTSSIVNVSVVGNEMKEGTSGALIRFTTDTMGAVDLINNIGPNGMDETLGAEPDMRKINNVLIAAS